MSFDKFIQTRTIAKTENLPSIPFPLYKLSSFIEFETDGYLVGVHFMLASVADNLAVGAVDYALPNGAIVAKVSGDQLSIPAGGTNHIINYQMSLLCHAIHGTINLCKWQLLPFASPDLTLIFYKEPNNHGLASSICLPR